MLAQEFTNISPKIAAAIENSTVPIINIDDERSDEAAQREALLDVVMGPTRKHKSSEKIRKNRLPADRLSLVARDDTGAVVGSVRLWHIRFANGDGGFTPALLLGPLAVNQNLSGKGIGTRLMVEAISRAKALGHGAILLVGDADYYRRFGFCTRKTAQLAMPGSFERHRFQGLELIDNWLNGAYGTIKPSGKKSPHMTYIFSNLSL